MPTRAIEMLTYNPAAAMIAETGLSPDDLRQLAPQLDAARQETLADAELWKSGGPVPKDKVPLDAGFIDLPERRLADYKAKRQESELGRVLAVAHRIREAVDRVVVLGIGGSYMGARALFEACCHPYHNELNRGDRGGRPRVYFEGNNVDNDASQGLLDLFGHGRLAKTTDDRWAIVVISKSGGTLETAASFRIFSAALEKSLGGDKKQLAELVVPITGKVSAPGKESKLLLLSQALGIADRDIFDIPDGVGGRFSILTAVGLLPAAIMGMNVVQLLEGAAAMNEHFRTAPPGKNLVLNYVGVCHLLEKLRGLTIRVMSTWGKGMEAAGMWYDQLLSESLGKQEQGATPITVVNTRDLHSRGQQHQEGRRDKLITNVIVDGVKRDRLTIGRSDHNEDQLNDLADKTLPEVLHAALLGTNQAYADDRRPTVDLHLPRLDETSMGQFFQMLMLATVVEGRLIGINPYGQPGVEGYKRHMQAFLRKG